MNDCKPVCTLLGCYKTKDAKWPELNDSSSNSRKWSTASISYLSGIHNYSEISIICLAYYRKIKHEILFSKRDGKSLETKKLSLLMMWLGGGYSNKVHEDNAIACRGDT